MGAKAIKILIYLVIALTPYNYFQVDPLYLKLTCIEYGYRIQDPLIPSRVSELNICTKYENQVVIE